MKKRILELLLSEPGIARQHLCEAFGLSVYRLNRVLRSIGRDLAHEAVVNHPQHGIWVVAVNPEKCVGMNWVGPESGGFLQCTRDPVFSDGQCYEHSEYESADMVAFSRTLSSLVGPAEPTPRSLCQIGLFRVEELLKRLQGISPATKRDFLTKQRLLAILNAAAAALKLRDRRRRTVRENWIPHEFWERHRRSSVNPFEFSLKKHFALLGVAVDATREEVLKAWKALCQQFHPDVAGGDEERMKRINLAKDQIFRVRRWR